MKNKSTIITIVIIIFFGIFTLIYFGGKDQVKNNDENKKSEIISRNGLHWHSTLLIYVKGQKLEIPANVGLGAVHNPIHTHTEDAPAGVIHMEFGELVRKSDTKLGGFFKVWNKDIRSFGPNMKMTVNGIDNTEYENYEMKDGDKIELRYD